MYEMERLVPPVNIESVHEVYGMENLIPPLAFSTNCTSACNGSATSLEQIFHNVQQRLKSLVLEVDHLKRQSNLRSKPYDLSHDGSSPTLIAVHCDPHAFPYSIFGILEELPKLGQRASLQCFKHSSLRDQDLPVNLWASLMSAQARHHQTQSPVDVSLRVVLMPLATPECQTVLNAFSDCVLLGESVFLRAVMLALRLYPSEGAEVLFPVLDQVLVTGNQPSTWAQLPAACDDPLLWPFVKIYIWSLVKRLNLPSNKLPPLAKKALQECAHLSL